MGRGCLDYVQFELSCYDQNIVVMSIPDVIKIACKQGF